MASVSLPHTLETVSGKFVDLLSPNPEDILIDDIAWSLSRLARYNGHTIQTIPYSVGQHSIVVSHEVEELIKNNPMIYSNYSDKHVKRLAMFGLLHDAPEYLTGDISGPLKKIPELRPIIKKIEKTIEDAIYKALDLDPLDETDEKIIKEADMVAQRVEAYNFMMSRGQGWTNMPKVSIMKLQNFELPQPSLEVYKNFLSRYESLLNSMK